MFFASPPAGSYYIDCHLNLPSRTTINSNQLSCSPISVTFLWNCSIRCKHPCQSPVIAGDAGSHIATNSQPHDTLLSAATVDSNLTHSQTTPHFLTMCQTESFASHTCAHKWMTIVKPCRHGGGFSSSNYHEYIPARQGAFAPRYIAATANSCPSCNKKGDYDGNLTRMVIENPAQMGGLGNGYTMTDGRGNVLPSGQGNVLPSGQGNGFPVPVRYSACGAARVGRPRPRAGQGMGCCAIM